MAVFLCLEIEMILRYILLLPAYILALLFGWLFHGVAAEFVRKDGSLPNWLSWFSTTNSNNFGNPGDKGFYEKYQKYTYTKEGRKMVATAWLFRNCMNGFRETVLGLKPGTPGIFQNHSQFNWNSTHRFRWNFGWKVGQPGSSGKCMMVASVSPYTTR